jgi:SAM-dependent methyltransferase
MLGRSHDLGHFIPRGLLSRVQRKAVRFARRAIDRVYPTRYQECPCCGELARTFLPHGPSQRPNARCPRCGSVERHRLQWLFFQNRTNLFSDASGPIEVLHFAPERGLQRRLKSLRHVSYHGADLKSVRAEEHFDICAIPYSPDSFDVILCSHVLEHVLDDRRAMCELFRVMKPGGWGLIGVPFDARLEETQEDPNIATDEERLRVYGNKGHVRRYGRDYHDRLRAAGFEVTTNRYAAELPPALVERYRLLRDGVVTIAVKPAR